jgi:capsular exopolysaccharide synthesis family protein
MEPIKQALERAHRERQTLAGVPQARAAATPPAPSQIEYKQTRRLEVPLEVLRENRVVAHLENDAIADAYKLLRTQVLLRMRDHGWKSLAITSPAQGQGKTLTSVNLAVSLAREVNHSVLLVDLDLRRPHVHKLFGAEPEYGLSEYLQNDIPLSEILFNPGIERLVVLPGGRPLSNSSEMLFTPKMVRLAEEVQNRYPNRLVLLDLPPLLATDDALAFLPHVDASLLVVQEGATLRDEVTRSLELLQENNLLGTVLNNSTQGDMGYYY